MLLFILPPFSPQVSTTDFNTSHVTVYHVPTLVIKNTLSISIHLMLLFIPFLYRKSVRRSAISIHLMLLFISILSFTLLLNLYFNTSHVTVYHASVFRCQNYLLDFNTSHVTVYLYLFSCHCTTPINFNTSHVTVYRFRIHSLFLRH